MKKTTEEFINSQRKELTKLEFDILYESKFPDQSEDAIFNMTKVEQSINSFPNFDSPWLIISCDVADKGIDKTVIIVGKQNKDDRKYIVNKIITEDISENVNVAGRINRLIFR